MYGGMGVCMEEWLMKAWEYEGTVCRHRSISGCMRVERYGGMAV